MKKLLIGIALFSASIAANSATVFNVAGQGKIIIGESGLNLSLYDNESKKGDSFIITQSTVRVKDCEIGEYVNELDNTDLFYITVCDSQYPFVNFKRNVSGETIGNWNIDASRYMQIINKDVK